MRSMIKNFAAAVAAVIVYSAVGVEGREPVETQKLVLDATPGFSVLKAGQKQQAWMRVGLKGFHLQRTGERAPVNVAIVLDRSGSMQGEKIQRAREAAIGALDLLSSNDIVSIIAYDSDVNVLVPATKLTDKKQVVKIIRAIQPGGNTALFGGVSKGAAEVRKFMDDKHVNRVILLSDGLANVGPSAPGELGDLGASMKKENISVSTLGLGLGYNEDLMVQLAGKSGGNHQFIENASELAGIFRREFDDVLSVVAQAVDVKIEIPEGIRPVRVLGNSADINGQSVITRLSQVYSDQQKYLVVEVEIPADLAHAAVDASGTEIAKPSQLASVSVSYVNMVSERTETLQGEVSISFSSSDEKVKASINNKVMADVVALVASEQNKMATDLLDRGDLEGCRRSLEENALFLNTNADAYNCPSLKELAELNLDQLKGLSDVTSNAAPAAARARKSMRGYQIESDSQQVKPAKP
ncbi:MAG: VWA domain-containing protein [Planctomycetota bacterium]|nr:VWA domain-containing protein [Planctomycetota bacterium]